MTTLRLPESSELLSLITNYADKVTIGCRDNRQIPRNLECLKDIGNDIHNFIAKKAMSQFKIHSRWNKSTDEELDCIYEWIEKFIMVYIFYIFVYKYVYAYLHYTIINRVCIAVYMCLSYQINLV